MFPSVIWWDWNDEQYCCPLSINLCCSDVVAARWVQVQRNALACTSLYHRSLEGAALSQRWTTLRYCTSGEWPKTMNIVHPFLADVSRWPFLSSVYLLSRPGTAQWYSSGLFASLVLSEQSRLFTEQFTVLYIVQSLSACSNSNLSLLWRMDFK